MMVCGHVPAQVAAVLCVSQKKAKKKLKLCLCLWPFILHIAGNDMRPHVPIWVLCKLFVVSIYE